MPFGLLAKKKGLHDFEIDTDFSEDEITIAKSAFLALYNDPNDPFDRAIFLGLIVFLELTRGAPREDPDRMMRGTALAAVPIGSDTEFENWARAWH